METVMSLNLDFDKLRGFVAVAEELHFTKAAQNRLHVSQPWLSKSVKDLEGRLGVALLHRHSRHVELTKEGRRFLYGLRGLIYNFDRTVSAVLRDKNDQQTLKVAYSSYVDLRFIAELKELDLKLQGPVLINFDASTSEDAVAQLESHERDLAITIVPIETAKLQVLALFRLPLAAAMEKAHPLAKRRTLRLEDLRDQKLIIPRKEPHSGFWAWLFDRFSEAGIKPNIVNEASSPHEGQYLVTRGAGISLADAGAFSAPLEGILVRPFSSERLQIETGVVLRREKHRPLVMAYVTRVQQLAKIRRRNRLPLQMAG